MALAGRVISSIDQNGWTENLIRKWEKGKDPNPFRKCALNSVNHYKISKCLSHNVYVAYQTLHTIP